MYSEINVIIRPLFYCVSAMCDIWIIMVNRFIAIGKIVRYTIDIGI